MSKLMVNDDRYDFREFIPSQVELIFVSRNRKKSNPLDIDAFMARAVTSNLPIEVINLEAGDLAPLPLSVMGKSTVMTVGLTTPAGYDQFSNLQLRMGKASAVEVIFNSEKIGSAGKNHGAHGKKIIYVVN